MKTEWIPTDAVKVGDKIALLLSDASAYVEVVGWSDRVLTLSRYGLKDVTHRTFEVAWEPWWAFDMKTTSLEGKTLVASREVVHYGSSRTACGDLRTHDTATTNIPDVTCSECITEVHRPV